MPAKSQKQIDTEFGKEMHRVLGGGACVETAVKLTIERERAAVWAEWEKVKYRHEWNGYDNVHDFHRWLKARCGK